MRKIPRTIYVHNTSLAYISFPALKQLEGSIVIEENHFAQEINLPRLQSVSNELRVKNNTRLGNIGVPYLYFVRAIDIAVNPTLQKLEFPRGLTNMDDFIITDNGIYAITGVVFETAHRISISSNVDLMKAEFPKLKRLESGLYIAANRETMEFTAPKLEHLGNATFSGVKAIDLPSLKKVEADFSFDENAFDWLSIPNITETGGSFSLTSNYELREISLPNLKSIGGALFINGNSNFNNLDDETFPSLRKVSGTVDITGPIDSLHLPSLREVRGGINIQSNSKSFSCKNVNGMKNGVVRGKFTCLAGVANPHPGISDAADSGSTSIRHNWDNQALSVAFIIAFMATLLF